MEPKSRFNLALIGLGVLIIVFIVIQFRDSLKENATNKVRIVDKVVSSDAAKASYKQNWDKFISVSLGYNYINEETGNREVLIKVENKMIYTAEKVEARLRVVASENREIKGEVVIFENVAPNSHKIIWLPNPNTNPEYLVIATLFKVRVDAIGLFWAAESKGSRF